jgi:hypothetical protein
MAQGRRVQRPDWRTRLGSLRRHIHHVPPCSAGSQRHGHPLWDRGWPCLGPGGALICDVGGILLGGMPGLRLNDQPRRWRNRCTVDGAKRSPCSRSSRSAISTSVRPGASATIPRIAGPTASILPDRLSPPWTRGAIEPVSNQSCRHFNTADRAIPKRFAAARQLRPPSIAAITRCLRSREIGFVTGADSLHQPQL